MLKNYWSCKVLTGIGVLFVHLGTLRADVGDLVQLTEHISPGGISNYLVGPGPTSESQRFYLTYNYEGTTNQPLDLVVVDSTTGRMDAYSAPLPATGRPERIAYGLSYSTNNKIYLGTMPGAHLLEFDPQHPSHGLVDYGNVSRSETHIWNLAKSTEGIIYGGTSPNGKLIRFNPTSQTMTDLGPIGTPGEDSFLRHIEVSTKGYVYCGTGSTNAKVVAYNTLTGQKLVILNSGETGYMEVAKRSDGFIWAVTPKTKRGYKLDEFNSTLATVLPSPLSKNRFADGTAISVPADPTKKIVVTKSNVSRDFDFTYAGKPRTIFRLAMANDGKIYASGILNFNLFSVDDHPGASPTQRGLLGSGEAYSFLPYENKILIAGYSANAPLMNYDPSQPISLANPVLAGKGVIPSDWRPWAMIAGPGGSNRVFVAGQPTQGTYGGPLVAWNIGTNAIEVNTPFSNQTISSLVLWGESLVGGTTINNGVGTTPKVSSCTLFIWDTTQNKVVHQVTLPGKQINDLQAVTKSGLTSIYGFVDNRLFVFDPNTKSIKLPNTKRINVISGNTYQSVALMPDENVWGLSWEGLFCIDTKTDQVRVAVNNPLPGKRPYGFSYKENKIYFSIESKMFRYTIPSNTVEQKVMGLSNPGFEETSSATEIPGWLRTGPKETISTTAGEFHSGTGGLKIVAEPGKWQMAWQDWKGYSVGTTYQLTFWGKVDSTEGLRGRVPVLTIPPGGGNSLIFAYVDVTEPTWTKYSMTFSTPTASDGLRIRCYENTITLNGTIYFDDFKITTVTKPSGPPNAPSGVTMTSGQGNIVLSWTEPNSLVDSYRVDLSTSSQFKSYVTGWQNKDVGHMNSVQISGLKANLLYYARVRAYNRIGGISAQSQTQSATLSGVPVAAPNVALPSPAPDTVDGARGYPVPFRAGTGAHGITFDLIPAETAVRIFTIDGQPVKTLTTNTEGSVLWDLTNDDNTPVASGVYLAIIEKNGGRKRLKVVVQK